MALITAAFVLGMIIWMALDTGGDTAARLFGIGFALIYGYIGFRAARSRVYAESRGVRIVNAFRTIDLSWGEIARFRVDRYGPYPKIGVAELKTGRRVHMAALQGPNPLGRPRNRTAENLVASLNGLLQDPRRNMEPIASDEEDGPTS